MNNAPRQKTSEMLQLETLLHRLPDTHPKFEKIHEQLLKLTAGHFGETTTDFYLKYLPKEFLVVQDVRLFDGIQHFQIDALIITQSFLLILEVKNFKGKLIFDFEHQQLFRLASGVKDIFADPFLQVEHQMRQLSLWLGLFRFPDIPIFSLIVIPNSKTLIKTHGKDSAHLKKRIVRPKNLVSKIEQIRSKVSKDQLVEPEVQMLAERIRREHVPFQASIMDRYRITMEELILGVQCPGCSRFSMERKRDHWRCIWCGEKSMDAHLRTLKDYQLLINKEITNAEFRKFAQIKTEYTARRLLLENSTSYSGTTRNRKYTIKGNL